METNWRQNDKVMKSIQLDTTFETKVFDLQQFQLYFVSKNLEMNTRKEIEMKLIWFLI